MKLRDVSMAALAAALLPCAAWAQDVTQNDEMGDIVPLTIGPDGQTIIVTGDRIANFMAPVSVRNILEAELSRLQSLSVADVLTTIPGVNVSRNGPIGGLTSVRIRGAETSQTLVVIDGVRVGDPTSPGGGFDFGSLLAGNIARIDVLRGSNSVVWGSDAIGGVVLVETGVASGITAEYGSNDTARLDGNHRLSAGPLSLNVGGGWFDTDGISAARSGTEADGFRQYRGNGRLAVDIADGLTASANVLYADSRLDIDGFAPPTFAFGDTGDVQETSELYTAARIAHDLGTFRHQLSFSLADINRDTLTNTGALSFGARGRSERVNWQGSWRGDDITLVVGAERESLRSFTENGFSSNRGRSAIIGVYGTVTLEPLEGVQVGLGGRFDDHSRFGGDTSLSANARVEVSEGVALRAGYSEGFKAPTLFQLSPTPSGFGNPVLQPEESTAYDVGVVFESDYYTSTYQPIGFRVEASLFRRDSRNLIDFVGCTGPNAPPICAGGTRPFGTYANIDRARAEGAEIDLMLTPTTGLTLRGGYAYIATRDRTPANENFGNRLARRPLHSGIVAVDYEGGGFSLGGDIRLVGDSFDDAGNRTRLDGYALANLRAAVEVTERVELFGRIENLLDADYQNVAGYSSYGRTASIGVRASL